MAGGKKTLKILAAEDDLMSRFLIQKLLSKWGEVHVAVNGEEALAAFIAAFEAGEKYDLLCLDLMMPLLDGHEVLTKIREYESNHDIATPNGVKVVMTTAVSDSKEVLSSFREGCEAYIVKPISAAILEAELTKLELIHT